MQTPLYLPISFRITKKSILYISPLFFFFHFPKYHNTVLTFFRHITKDFMKAFLCAVFYSFLCAVLHSIFLYQNPCCFFFILYFTFHKALSTGSFLTVTCVTLQKKIRKSFFYLATTGESSL